MSTSIKNILGLAKEALAGNNEALAQLNDVFEENDIEKHKLKEFYFYLSSSFPRIQAEFTHYIMLLIRMILTI